jgi:exodeoxyribonuclease-3
MRLASWNVNSLKVRLPQLLEWLARHNPDVVCLQETKVENDKFPAMEIEAAGYRCAWSGQKTYNGVAILSRRPLGEPTIGIPAFADDQKRVIAASIGDGPGGIRVVCAYVPNGQDVGTDKYAYKLRWLAALRNWLEQELHGTARLAVLGDYNVAPADADVHDPGVWRDKVLCSMPEREAFEKILGVGLKDAFRLFAQKEKSFTWWDYRMNGFKRNLGLRIDHILLGPGLASACRACAIDLEPRRAERPSDHAPIMADIDA